MTVLTLGLCDQALTVLEALGKEVIYEQLFEALEASYGNAHLEHVFRAQLKDRVQRTNEDLQQWALEVEKLIRKAYQSVPALIEGYLEQIFIVRAAVRLGHHETLKNALAHALEVEAVRQNYRFNPSARLQQLQFTSAINHSALSATAVGKGPSSIQLP